MYARKKLNFRQQTHMNASSTNKNGRIISSDIVTELGWVLIYYIKEQKPTTAASAGQCEAESILTLSKFSLTQKK